MTEIQHHYFDIVIVGGGGAGLMAAIHGLEKDYSVALISKVFPTRSHTVAAQGGINAALNTAEDKWQWHFYDTVKGSDFLGDQHAIAHMCKSAPEAIYQLEQMGVPFTRNPDGSLYQRTYGGQRTQNGKGPFAKRAACASDRTGQAILHTLYGQFLKLRGQCFSEMIVLDLIMLDPLHCIGVSCWDLSTGKLEIFHAHHVILATGGAGQLYQSTTTASICTGDGHAMALRAGLPLQDMEFVQFHPTGLYGSGILVSEAARSEGGILKNGQGEAFMQHYAKLDKDLAPRDLVARAIATEIQQGRGAGPNKDHVYLSLETLSEEHITRFIPNVREAVRTFAKIDPFYDPIPIVPTCHYMMGGIATAIDTHIHDQQGNPITGLYAIGEAACISIHGANRLGCNSLLDLIVFAKQAIDTIASIPQATIHPTLTSSQTSEAFHQFHQYFRKQGDINPHELRTHMRHIIQTHAGVFRNATLLKKAVQEIKQLLRDLDHVVVKDQGYVWNSNLIDTLEVANMLPIALTLLHAALHREESRGAHFREDFPQRDDQNFLYHTLTSLHNNEVVLSNKPVTMETHDPDVNAVKLEGKT